MCLVLLVIRIDNVSTVIDYHLDKAALPTTDNIDNCSGQVSEGLFTLDQQYKMDQHIHWQIAVREGLIFLADNQVILDPVHTVTVIALTESEAHALLCRGSRP